MGVNIQPDARAKRRWVYRWLFTVAAVLTFVGMLFWPLELDVYRGEDGTRMWSWNAGPSVSTETAALWHYYSFRPLLYATALLAVISVVLYRRDGTRNG